MRRFHYLLKGIPMRGVKVYHKEVRLLQAVYPRKPWIHLYTAQVSQVQQSSLIITDHVVDMLTITPRPDLLLTHPFRSLISGILLIKARISDPMRIALQRQWPILQIRQNIL